MNVCRVAVVLSGCGVHDGSDVHESALALLSLDRAGAHVFFVAPDIAVPAVVNHLTGDPMAFDSRNVRVESARIARGPVRSLADLRVADYDAILFPGGFGATHVLCDHAKRGRGAVVLADVVRVITEAHAARKPQAFLCAAAVVAARVLGARAPTLTIGNDVALAADLESWGARHEGCDASRVVIDRDHRLVSTPAYLTATRVSEVADGVDRAVRVLLEMVGTKRR